MVDFEYNGRTKEYSQGYIRKSKNSRTSIIKFPTRYHQPEKGAETVEFYLFDPKEKPAGLLVLLHGLGTTNVPFLLWMASRLANAGIRTVLPVLPGNFTRTADGSVSGKDFFDRDVDHATKFWEHSAVDVFSIIDFLKDRGLWLENSHLFGFCLGGMLAVMISAIRKEFRKTYLMTVGGEMATLLWYSPTLAYFRRSVEDFPEADWNIGRRDDMLRDYETDMERLAGFETVRQMQESDIHPYLKIDPIAYARFVDTKSIVFIEARFDKALPKRSRRLLWEALGRPRRYVVPMGHVTWLPFQFIIAKFILGSMGVKAFRKKLKLLKKLKPEEQSRFAG
ncbi:MAG: alpha/beta hydrolase [Spirochaetales bacterium]|nr:alpha/beta hydrolase [Spirochaetales bacterium]MCF7938378.1 alpha/beta hydrolase [Spirochaetales bacterium]